jgi:hypothetical protein
MNERYIKLKQLIELAKELGVDEGPWFRGIELRLSYSWNEVLYLQTLQTLRRRDMRPILDRTFKIPMSPDDLAAVDGPFKIGTIANTDIEYGFHLLQLLMHGVWGGSSGFGKSNCVNVLGQEMLLKSDVKLWLIDPKLAGDYRLLAKMFGALVLVPDVMKCNPFNMITNVSSKMLREFIGEVTADAFGVYDASAGMIADHIHKIFHEKEQRTLADFVESLHSEKGIRYGRKQGYVDTIDSRLKLIDTSLEYIVDCREDYFHKLFDRNVVFEIGGLSGAAQRIMMHWIIMKLVLHKIMNPTEKLSHLLIFDEAQSQLWSRYIKERGRQSFMATLATQCRAYGLGLIVLAQNPATKLMREIIANSAIKLCFHLGHGDEVIGFGRSMGLNNEQMEEFHHIKPGEAICRVGLGFTEAVKLNVRYFPNQNISNEELERLMRPQWDELLEGIQPARPKQLQLPVSKAVPKPEKSKAQTSKSSNSDLSPEEISYLRIVSSHPWHLLSEIYAIVGDSRVMGTGTIGQSTAVKIRKGLINKGYLMTYNVISTGKSGRSYSDLVTEKAGMGKVEKPRGGNLHSWWCYRVAEFLKKEGADVTIGDTTSGNELDVTAKIDGKRFGLEIVLSSFAVDNVTTHMKYVDELRILCTDKKKISKQIKGFSEDIQAKVKIQLLKEYFIPL